VILSGFDVIISFRKDRPQSEGRRYAHPGIKAPPVRRGKAKGAPRRVLINYKGPRYSGGDLKVSVCISQQAEFVFDGLISCRPILGGICD
jgi:hypothetical protein